MSPGTKLNYLGTITLAVICIFIFGLIRVTSVTKQREANKNLKWEKKVSDSHEHIWYNFKLESYELLNKFETCKCCGLTRLKPEYKNLITPKTVK